MIACRYCGQEIDRAVQVTTATVLDIFEIWLAQDNSARTRLTERIPIICVQSGTAPPKQPLTEAEAEQSRMNYTNRFR